VATLLVHRSDLDDAFFVGHAVGIADHPGAPILAQDTLHGLDGLPLALPVYKVETLGVGVAALAFLTPFEPLDIAHFVVPTLAAFLVPLAYATLFRRLLPRSWLWGVGIAVAFLWCAGDTHFGYGNFAFVRLFQGKGIFRSVAVPLILSAALDFGRAPNLRRWRRLAATQIAAIGLTSSALVVAPTLAGLGLLAGIPWRRGFGRRLAFGVTASLYGLMLAGWMFTQMPAPGAGSGVSKPQGAVAAPTQAPGQEPMAQAADQVLGTGQLANLAVLAILGAGIVGGSKLGRRFALILSLGFLLVLWNPFVDGWLHEYIFSSRAYWRIFWVLPLPALIALLLTAPLSIPGQGLKALVRGISTAGLAALVLLVAPETYTGSQDNRAHWGWPRWKVPESDFAVAQAIAEHASPEETVLAPLKISAWIVTRPNHPRSLMVRRQYLRSIREGLGYEETLRRLTLVRWTEERLPARDAEVAAALDHYDIPALCLRQGVSRDARVQTLLKGKGFETVYSSDRYVVWVRSN